MAEPMTWRQRRACPHSRLRGIYGDEIITAGFKRLRCLDCGRLLDGSVRLAESRREQALNTSQVRSGFAFIPASTTAMKWSEAEAERFDRWLADHDAEVRAGVLSLLESSDSGSDT
jgi:hypothetical protein